MSTLRKSFSYFSSVRLSDQMFCLLLRGPLARSGRRAAAAAALSISSVRSRKMPAANRECLCPPHRPLIANPPTSLFPAATPT